MILHKKLMIEIIMLIVMDIVRRPLGGVLTLGDLGGLSSPFWAVGHGRHRKGVP